MAKMHPYFVFKGETKEAVALYAKLFNAKNVNVLTFGEMPEDQHIPYRRKLSI